MSQTIAPSAVQHIYCFRDLDTEDAMKAAACLEPVHYLAGEQVFREGDAGDHAYFVAYGRVEISIATRSGQRCVLANLQAGSLFGEICLLLDEPRTATATVTGDSHLLRLSRQRFEEEYEAGEPWARVFLLAAAQTLAHRLTWVDQKFAQLVCEPQRQTVRELEELCHRIMAR